MTATLHALYPDATADDLAALDPSRDLAPRLVGGPRVTVPGPARGAACIVVEHLRPGQTDPDTLYAADTAEHRNPAHWRALLGVGRLSLASHPLGVDDGPGMATRRPLGTWAADEEAPDLTRFDAAPKRVDIVVAGRSVEGVLMACPNGKPVYGLPDVCWLAQLARAARKNNNSGAMRHGRE